MSKIRKNDNKDTSNSIKLFDAEELDYFEGLRQKCFDIYEKQNPQFVDEDFESYSKAKVEGERSFTSVVRRYQFALIGYDYSVANNILKQFTKTGDIQHLENAIHVLWTKAFSNELIVNIFYNLNKKQSLALWLDDKKQIKIIEELFCRIGKTLLLDDKTVIKPHKSNILLRRLQVMLSKKLSFELTPQNTLKYIDQLYTDIKKKLSNQPSLQVNADIDSIISENKKMLDLNKKQLRTTSKPEVIKLLNEEIYDLEKHIAKLELSENMLYKEARKQTIKKLEEITGIKVGSTNFKEILTLINKLKQEESTQSPLQISNQ